MKFTLRIISLILSFVFIGCCNNEDHLDNGLTKSVNQIVEYYILIERDSLHKEVLDTLMITTTQYNAQNLKTSQHIEYPKTKDYFDIKFIYNDDSNIEKEIVIVLADNNSFEVDYLYKEDLLQKTHSISITEPIRNEQIEVFEYDENGNIKQRSISKRSTYIENYKVDSHTYQIETYNDKLFITESKYIDFLRPEKSFTTIYKYNCRNLTEAKEYDANGELITIVKYVQENDKYGNWIRLIAKEDGKPTHIKVRKIDYK